MPQVTRHKVEDFYVCPKHVTFPSLQLDPLGGTIIYSCPRNKRLVRVSALDKIYTESLCSTDKMKRAVSLASHLKKKDLKQKGKGEGVGL